jgi:hypothetical protein
MKPGTGATKSVSPRKASEPIRRRWRLQPPFEVHDTPVEPLELIRRDFHELGRAVPAGITQIAAVLPQLRAQGAHVPLGQPKQVAPGFDIQFSACSSVLEQVTIVALIHIVQSLFIAL